MPFTEATKQEGVAGLELGNSILKLIVKHLSGTLLSKAFSVLFQRWTW